MKRVLLSVTATVLGLVALLSFKTKSPIATSAALPSGSTSSTSTTTAPAPSKSTTPSRRASTSSASAAKKYTGRAVQTQYGVVQVAVTVTARHIDSVSFVQLTAFDQRSEQINSQAGPILIDETLQAQNAQIDTVSGATYTSDGYLQSLQSALDKAGI